MGASGSKGRPCRVFFVVAAGAFALDQLTKAAAREWVDPAQPIGLVGNWVRLTRVHNTGSAFGLVSSGWVLVLVGVLVSVAVLGYVVTRRGLATEPGRALPLGLVLGGSLGNLLDRLRTGGVTDFIDLRVWPVFNLADVGITVAVALLAVGLIRPR